MSIFALNVAVSGLRASQYAMNTTAHNIANAGTPGYHRQEAIFLPGTTITGAASITGIGIPTLGTGVEVRAVRRAQTDYIDQQIWTTNQWSGAWAFRNEGLKQVESLLGEPGEMGLSSAMDRFWNSWQDLATSPSSTTRESVVAEGVALSSKIRGLHKNLRNLQSEADRNLVDDVAQVNRLAHEIADLNKEIRRAIGAGGQPNDMLDRRNLLLDELSKTVKIDVAGTSSGEMIVSISGRALIQGNLVSDLSIVEGAGGWSEVVWAADGTAANITGGRMAGEIQMRDEILEGYIQSLNTITSTIVDRVNALHSTGLTEAGLPAGNFFIAGSDSSNIDVDPSLIDAPSGVATSTTGNSGDNQLALDIFNIRTEFLIDGGTIESAYAALVGRIGAHTREADSRVDTHDLSLNQLRTQRESMSGISLDEEMANMVKFQQAYNAAARVFTVIDEMIEVTVNKLGTGGR